MRVAVRPTWSTATPASSAPSGIPAQQPALTRPNPRARRPGGIRSSMTTEMIGFRAPEEKPAATLIARSAGSGR
jgi:hypothetical protein